LQQGLLLRRPQPLELVAGLAGLGLQLLDGGLLGGQRGLGPFDLGRDRPRGLHPFQP